MTMHHHDDSMTPIQLLGVLTLFKWLNPPPKPEPPKPEPRPTPRDLGMAPPFKSTGDFFEDLFGPNYPRQSTTAESHPPKVRRWWSRD
jgi:hypothetical protein